MKIEKLEKALNFVNEKIRSIELATTINGCEMTETWRDSLEIYRTIKEVLEKEIEEMKK